MARAERARGAQAGLSRERIVAAAVELADSDGLGALSMARLAERLGCGTMSLYRHVANKDELVTFMLSTAPGPPPAPTDPADWRGALTDWAAGLWDIYHRHPWVLRPPRPARPPTPASWPGWTPGLAALGGTGLAERDKLAAVMAVLHFVRGAAALNIEAARCRARTTPSCSGGSSTPNDSRRSLRRWRPGYSTRRRGSPGRLPLGAGAAARRRGRADASVSG